MGGRLVGGTMPAGGGGPGLDACGGPLRAWRVGPRLRDHGGARRRRPRSRDTGGALLLLGEPCAGGAGPGPARRRGGLRPPRGGARRGPRPGDPGGRGRTGAGRRPACTPARPHDAARVAQESFDSAAAVGAWQQAAFSRSLMGRALAAAGDRERAIEALREAERELDRFGSVRERDAARRELRKLGARAEPRGPATAEDSGMAALTKRELEIAALVTDRKTNREIASELFLSAKTIESHMRNIFVKLGASSRVEVARTVERDRREREDAPASEAGAPTADPDAARLRELGYRQELERKLQHLRQRRDGLRGHLAGGRPLRSRAGGVHGGRSGVGVGAPHCARRAVPAAGRLLGAGLGVPDRGRRLPVDQAADRRSATGGSAGGWPSAPTRWRTRRSPTSARRGR